MPQWLSTKNIEEQRRIDLYLHENILYYNLDYGNISSLKRYGKLQKYPVDLILNAINSRKAESGYAYGTCKCGFVIKCVIDNSEKLATKLSTYIEGQGKCGKENDI